MRRSKSTCYAPRPARAGFALLLLVACHRPVSPSEPVAAAAAPKPDLVRQEVHAMGTSVELVAWTADNPGATRAFTAAFAEMHRLEVLMTTWAHPGWPLSDINALNQAAGIRPVTVSPETFEVLNAAQEMSRLSDGAFDVTFAVLSQLWHFDSDLQPVVPSAAAIAQRLPLINYQHLQFGPGEAQVFLQHAGMRVGLGGIAKGYIVDAAVRVLHDAGFHDFLVQAGGDLYAAGTKGGESWKVGVRDPRQAGAPPFAVAHIRDHAFSTAGDYERAFVVAGKRYHHILDPKTGYPATASRSVTVFARTALLADSLDDALFILGPEKGLALLQRSFPEVGAVIVDANNRVWLSPNLNDVVEMQHVPAP